MVEDRIDPSEQIPEADLVAQQAPLDPRSLTDAETAPTIDDTPNDTVAEADRIEQHVPMPGDDAEDYPHRPGMAEWS